MKRHHLRVCVSLWFLSFLPAALAQTRSPLEFEVASIKPTNTAPGRDAYGGGYCHGTDTKPGTYPRLAAPTPLGQCIFTSVYLNYLVRAAYALELGPAIDLVEGVPAWANSQRFTLTARAEDTSTATEKMLRQMMQTMLADRFKLKSHFESKDMQGYGLYISKNGPRLQESEGKELPRIVGAYSGLPDLFLMVATNASTRRLAGSLSTMGIGPVVDKTELQGSYDFTLTFDREIITAGKAANARSALEPSGASGPTLFTAVEEQLGLRLVREKVRVQYLVVDSVERPSEN